MNLTYSAGEKNSKEINRDEKYPRDCPTIVDDCQMMLLTDDT